MDLTQSKFLVSSSYATSLTESDDLVAAFLNNALAAQNQDTGQYALKGAKRDTYKALQAIFTSYRFVHALSTDTYFYSHADTPNLYLRLTTQFLQNLARDGLFSVGALPDARQITATADTLLTFIRTETPTEDTRFMGITSQLFWDTDTQEFTPDPSSPCFKRLFDNGDLQSSAIIQIDPEALNPALLQAIHRTTYAYLEYSGGDLPEMGASRDLLDDEVVAVLKKANIPDGYIPDFDFFDVWACHDHGVYMDLLKAAATLFMSNKPKKVFALSGLRRNGKTTYIALLHTLLGRANTSDVQLQGLKDFQFTEKLIGTMMNAPDEETPTDKLDAIAIAHYKSIASHEPITLSRKHKEAQFIPTDFTCFMPYNQDPKWKGAGAAACAKRMIIIPFMADLSQYDTAGKDFKKETFTPQMFTELIGVLTAIARYYNDKEMTFSETSMTETEDVNEDVMREYAKAFLEYFDGYDDRTTVWNDYCYWCEKNDYSYKGDSKDDLLRTIKHLSGGAPERTNRAVGLSGKRKVYVYPHHFSGMIFSGDTRVHAGTYNTTISEIHKSFISVVGVLVDG